MSLEWGGVIQTNFCWPKHYRKDHRLLNSPTVQEKPYFFLLTHLSSTPFVWLKGWVTALLGIDSVPENHAITNVMASSLNQRLGKPWLVLKLYFLSAHNLNLAPSIHFMVSYCHKILHRSRKPLKHFKSSCSKRIRHQDHNSQLKTSLQPG